jgi:hypothetical protein
VVCWEEVGEGSGAGTRYTTRTHDSDPKARYSIGWITAAAVRPSLVLWTPPAPGNASAGGCEWPRTPDDSPFPCSCGDGPCLKLAPAAVPFGWFAAGGARAQLTRWKWGRLNRSCPVAGRQTFTLAWPASLREAPEARRSPSVLNARLVMGPARQEGRWGGRGWHDCGNISEPTCTGWHLSWMPG